MMEILLSSCSTDISSCCSDFAIAKYISIVKAVLNVIHIVVPIILIIMAIIDVTKLVADPDDKGEKIKHSLKNKIVATVIVFFIPYLTNFVINLASYANINAFEITSCWNEAENMAKLLEDNSTNYEIMNDSTFEAYSGVKLKHKRQYKNANKKHKESANNSNSTNNTNTKNGETSKYILVGDSRTVQMYAYVHNTWDKNKTNKLPNGVSDGDVYWSCKGSMGLSWMKETGIPNIENQIAKDSSIVIMMGVNDLYNADNYIKYVNKNSKSWLKKGADVYFVSVNPTDGKENKLNTTINSFNKKLEKGLKNVTWLDTNSYLKEKGYKTTDGLHYDKNTSMKLYKYIKSHT